MARLNSPAILQKVGDFEWKSAHHTSSGVVVGSDGRFEFVPDEQQFTLAFALGLCAPYSPDGRQAQAEDYHRDEQANIREPGAAV